MWTIILCYSVESYIEQELVRLKDKTVKDDQTRRDCLTGAGSVEEAIDLHQQLITLFSKGGILLRKWNSSNSQVVDCIDPELRGVQPTHQIPTPEDYTKTLGIE